MSDPVSVAGSAVGVISLGIQVCQQIVSYCQSWRGYDQDIQKVASKADGLRTPLKKLREMIENVQITDPEIASDLEKKTLGIQQQVNRLKATVDRYKPVYSSNSLPNKINAQVKKAVYPFRRDALRDMESDLDGIQIALQTTLDIHSAQKMVELGLVQETILNEIQDIRLVLQDVPTKGMPPPGMLQSWCDHYQQTGKWVERATSSADANCPGINRYSKSSHGETSVTKSYNFYSRLLHLAITTSFSLSKGAGGFSIAPELHVQSVVSHCSWIGDFWQELNINFFNASTSLKKEKIVDNAINQLQQAFTEGRAAPSDIVCISNDNMKSLVDFLCDWTMMFNYRGTNLNPHKLIKFLTDCGSMPNTYCDGALRNLCWSIPFGEEEFSLASHLISLGGPLSLTYAPYSLISKQNLKFLHSRNEELLSIPHIARVILRESEEQLEHALASGSACPDDTVGHSCSLLEFAFGWPRGVQIFLESGADAKQIRLPLPDDLWQIDDMDPKHDGYTPSAQLLLEAGCKIHIQDPSFCESRRIRSAMISHLAGRRRRLWWMAQAYLPAHELPDFGQDKDAIPDMHESGIYAALLAQGRHIDPSLHLDELPDYASLPRSCRTETLEEMYNVGFRVAGSLGFGGLTSLMNSWDFSYGFLSTIEKAAWYISKGVNPSQTLPLSNTTVAHLLSAKITHAITENLVITRAPKEYWQTWKEDLLRAGDGVFLIPSVKDDCVCACCPGGCTTLSVALRGCVRVLFRSSFVDYGFWFRQILQFLIEWTKSRPGVDQAVIRFLTFDALGLKHTCCVEINDYDDAKDMESRDKSEIMNILDEDRRGLEDLELLVPEFEAKFEELGLPVMEFLESYWHTRMLEFLLKRDPYDEEHHKGARSLGVFLEAEEDDIPDRISLLVGAQVKELDDDGLP